MLLGASPERAASTSRARPGRAATRRRWRADRASARAPSCRTPRRGRAGRRGPSAMQLVVRQAQRVAQRPEVLLDQVGREAVVAGRHRRVRREDDLRRDTRRMASSASMPSASMRVPHQLERGERAVALVQVHARPARCPARAARARRRRRAAAPGGCARGRRRRRAAPSARDPRAGCPRRRSRAAAACCGRPPASRRARRSVPVRVSIVTMTGMPSRRGRLERQQRGCRRRCSPRAASPRGRAAAGSSPGRSRGRRRPAGCRGRRRS